MNRYRRRPIHRRYESLYQQPVYRPSWPGYVAMALVWGAIGVIGWLIGRGLAS